MRGRRDGLPIGDRASTGFQCCDRFLDVGCADRASFSLSYYVTDNLSGGRDLKNMQEPFIVRVFQIDGRNVECRFFQPQEDGGDYLCRYIIDFPDKPRKSQGYGVDAVQALLLAMKKAHVELLVMRDKVGRRIEWLDQENLGLPLDEVVRDLSPKNSY